MQPPVSDLPAGQVLFEGAAFAEWSSLNDTIMGGRSRAGCRVDADGLVLEGELIEQGGGFVSCRSPRLQPLWISRLIQRCSWMCKPRGGP